MPEYHTGCSVRAEAKGMLMVRQWSGELSMQKRRHLMHRNAKPLSSGQRICLFTAAENSNQSASNSKETKAGLHAKYMRNSQDYHKYESEASAPECLTRNSIPKKVG